MSKAYQSVVIGAGPGGYVAALRLADHDLKVAVVENRDLGGTCLNRGCIPTKALLHSSEIADHIGKAEEYGISVSDFQVSLKAMIQRKNNVVKKLRSGVKSLLKARKVDVYEGVGVLSGDKRVEVTLKNGQSESLEAENIVIATGSEPGVPVFLPQDRSVVMTSDEILDLEEQPESLLIVGGGVIGCEFATLFSELGTEVTVVEMLDRILPMADTDISKSLTKHFQGQDVAVHTGVGVAKMAIVGGKVKAELQDGTVIEAEKALVCTGRRPVSEGLGFEEIGLEMEKGFIKVDDYCCTNVPGIYAIGDVTGKWQLAHVASRQGQVAANNIAGIEDSEDYLIVPSAVYTHPEAAWVGLTLEEAKGRGLNAREAVFPMMALGRAVAYDQIGGFVKIVSGDDGEILGAHLYCPAAADIIQEIAVLMKSECTVAELAATIHGHPTFAESLAEAAEALLGHPLHSM